MILVFQTHAVKGQSSKCRDTKFVNFFRHVYFEDYFRQFLASATENRLV